MVVGLDEDKIDEGGGSAALAPGWERINGRRLRDADLCRAIWRLMEKTRDSILQHDPVWLGAGAEQSDQSPAGSNEMYVYRGNEGVIAYAPFVAGLRYLRFAVGELHLYRHRMPSLSLLHDIVFDGEPQMRCALTRQLLSLLARRLRPGVAVFLEGVPTDSILYQLAAKPGGVPRLLTLHLGEVFQHQFTKLPVTFREYETQLGAHSRLNLRRRRKKLVEHVAGDLRTQRFTEENQVEQFVTDARKVSKTTYQWRLLGLGLRDAEGLRATLARAAQNGWLRCYILYCRGEPVAFMQGYLYRKTYHYMDVGYDPQWARWGVGSVLQMDVMRDLIEDPNRLEMFDFSTGFGDHKARFGNISCPEANLMLLRNCPRNAAIAAAYSLTAAVDRYGGGLMDKLGIKAQLKRWLRRTA